MIQPSPQLETSDVLYGGPGMASWTLPPQNLTVRDSGEPQWQRHRLHDHARGARVDAWREIVSTTFTPLSPEPLGDGEFHAGLDTTARADMKLSHIRAAPQRVLRGPREIGSARASTVFMNVQLEGESIVRHARGEASMRPGNCVLVNPHEAFSLEFRADFRQLCVQLPEWWLSDGAELPIEALAGVCVDLRSGGGQVLRAALRSLMAASGEEESRDMASLLCDVVNRTMAIEARRQRGDDVAMASGARGGARLQHFLQDHFRDETLTAVHAAQELGCSVRSIQKICMSMGTTFGKLLLERRLMAAAHRLAATSGAGRVGDIAYECGFNDLSYFSRSFRARFGVSPRAFRGGSR